MGTAEQVAATAAKQLSLWGHQVSMNNGFVAGQLDDLAQVALICTSNTGMGDLPANILPLHQHLVSDLPKIAGKRFGIINLGDSSYPNFAQAGKTLDTALQDIGAVRLGEPLVMDAIHEENYHQTATHWLEKWVDLL